MIYRTEFDLEKVDEQELCDLVNQLAKVSGGKIEVEKQIVFSTDDTDLSSMLDSLKYAMSNGNTVSNEPKKKKKAESKKPKVKKQDGEKKEPTRGPHVRSIKVNGSGEMISRFELNRRLSEHSIEPGTELHSPKYGKIHVTFESAESPYLVIDESGNAV